MLSPFSRTESRLDEVLIARAVGRRMVDVMLFAQKTLSVSCMFVVFVLLVCKVLIA